MARSAKSISNCCRIKAEKTAKKEGDIFDAKKEGYKPSEQRKKDQVAVDTQVQNISSLREILHI